MGQSAICLWGQYETAVVTLALQVCLFNILACLSSMGALIDHVTLSILLLSATLT